MSGVWWVSNEAKGWKGEQETDRLLWMWWCRRRATDWWKSSREAGSEVLVLVSREMRVVENGEKTFWMLVSRSVVR